MISVFLHNLKRTSFWAGELQDFGFIAIAPVKIFIVSEVWKEFLYSFFLKAFGVFQTSLRKVVVK